MEKERFDLENVEGLSYSDFLNIIEKKMDPHSNYVLLIDDEVGIRKKVARDIRSFDQNIQIYEAGNGKEAIEVLKKTHEKYMKAPLFMVVDLNMPVMDGWTFIKEMKKEYESHGETSGTPIIVLSSTSGESGILFTKKTVHNDKTGYHPLVTIAKENCTDNRKYDSQGEKNLISWLKHFAKIVERRQGG